MANYFAILSADIFANHFSLTKIESQSPPDDLLTMSLFFLPLAGGRGIHGIGTRREKCPQGQNIDLSRGALGDEVPAAQSALLEDLSLPMTANMQANLPFSLLSVKMQVNSPFSLPM